jgi:hypothetical protein
MQVYGTRAVIVQNQGVSRLAAYVHAAVRWSLMALASFAALQHCGSLLGA